MLPAYPDSAWCFLANSSSLVDRSTPDRRTRHPVITGVNDNKQIGWFAIQDNPVTAPFRQLLLNVVAGDRVRLRLVQRFADIWIDHNM